MPAPEFREVAAEPGCACAGCVRQRRDAFRLVTSHAGTAAPGHRAATRALVLVTAAGTVLGGAGAAEAARPAYAHGQSTEAAEPSPSTPQGRTGPLHTTALDVTPAAFSSRGTTREQILQRAQTWVDARVPYSMNAYRGGYRTDCSGLVSMAWGLGSNEWTGSLARYGTRISRSELRPGDMLLFHNSADPVRGSHVVIFGGWADSSRTRYVAYEQTRPHALKRTTPYAYWNNSSRYVAYRYNGLREGGGSGGGSGGAPGAGHGFPGASAFGPGQRNAHVTELGRMLVRRGGGRFYTVGPGPSWGVADRSATRAFQEAQGWRGTEADGIPGPATWALLVSGKGRDIPGGGGGPTAPSFPGTAKFRPGQYGPHVTELGRRLVSKGYGRYYTQGPGPRWTESDRRNVAAFQRAQGWRGQEADGYPGPETWKRLFR
ncbi:peptidoglycan-binding protein [Streptomyces sp. Da 82-17]|uniref:peptidoglycan-binding protein n=1 Tax=Streptomyces sp. Da 82-17 TaxID=3377116 RepID=UPI0038D46D59